MDDAPRNLAIHTVGLLDGVGPTTGYPWAPGDKIYAADLNMAISNSSALGGIRGPANVLDYGADPTGVMDSTAAINTAISAGKGVFIPTGTYRINGQINVLPGTTVQGAGVKSTFLMIDQQFSPTALGVISLNGFETASPALHDFSIMFAQPTDTVTTAVGTIGATGSVTVIVASATGIAVGNYIAGPNAAIPALATVTAIAGTVLTLSTPTVAPGVANGDVLRFGPSRANFKTLASGGTSVMGGTGVKYPPAIYAPGTQTGRPHLQDVYVGGAWDGIFMSGNVVPFIANIEMGALNIGWQTDGGLDVTHVKNWRSWPFNLFSNIQMGAFNTHHDGVPNAWQLGRIDGLIASGITFVDANFVTTVNANLPGGLPVPWLITDLLLDNTSDLVVAGGTLRITNMVRGSSTHPPGSPSAIQITGGITDIVNGHIIQNGTVPTVSLTGGRFMLSGSDIIMANGITSFVNQTGGVLVLSGNYITGVPVVTTPIINQTGGVIIVQGNAAHGATSGVVISVGADDPHNTILGNDFQEYTIALPAGALQGIYQTGPITWPNGRFLNGLTVGPPAVAGAAANLNLTTSAGAQRALVVYTDGNLRWGLTFTGADPGDGSNTGSDLVLVSSNDSGAFLHQPLSIKRATGTLVMESLETAAFLLSGNPAAVPAGRQTVTGAKGGNTALASLLTALAAFGLITDSTTA